MSRRRDRPWDPRWDWSRDYEYLVTHTQGDWGLAVHLRVRRRDGADGIAWDVLWRIKNDVVGEDVTMVEFYPARSDLVNETNLRHLWEVPRALGRLGLHNRGLPT